MPLLNLYLCSLGFKNDNCGGVEISSSVQCRVKFTAGQKDVYHIEIFMLAVG